MTRRSAVRMDVEVLGGGVPVLLVERYADLRPFALVADEGGGLHTLWPVRGCPASVPDSFAPDGWPALAALIRRAVPELTTGG
ncbi:MAG: hypothetical protein HKM95_11700 [Inquilinus sp.]|nr:hypothetical protein [Inquilinus sp.]